MRFALLFYIMFISICDRLYIQVIVNLRVAYFFLSEADCGEGVRATNTISRSCKQEWPRIDTQSPSREKERGGKQ